MKFQVLFILLIFPLIHSQHVNKVKSSLHSLRTILINMRHFSNQLRDLKNVLQEMKNKKSKTGISLIVPAISKIQNLVTNSSSAPDPLGQSRVTDVNKIIESTSKAASIRKEMPYSSFSIMTAKRMGSDLTKEAYCAKYCKNILKKIKIKTKEFYKLNSTFTIVKGCGDKHFYLAKKKDMLQNGWDYCCNRGLLPGKINTTEELNCVLEGYRNSNERRDIDLFTSAYGDVNMERKFYACVHNEYAPEHMWLPGQPDNSDQTSIIIALWLPYDRKKPAGYDDYFPMARGYVICEIPAF